MGMAERKAKCWALVRKHYANVPRRECYIDQAVQENIRPGVTLLDAGCGDTLALLNRYASKVSLAVGIDVVTPSQRPAENGAVTVGNLSELPFRNGTFDLIVSRSVVEHLEAPAAVFRELARTLRPGGKLIFTTPNRYHYSSLVAKMIPCSWKDLYMRHILAEDGYDRFPVFYQANTRPAVVRVAAGAGLHILRLQGLRHYPYYFLFSRILFWVGMIYDWLITGIGLDSLQSTWFVVMERPRN